ncbi:MAG TPA: ketopantoate reductase family protein [bacterium]|nr:ketopantoate reductase family protein [bacterium]
MSARVLVLGCGAVGGIFAARLAQVCDVAVLDTWTAHVAAITARGLRVRVRAGSAGETIEARPAQAASAPAALSTGPAFTHALVAVKGPHTQAAAKGARALLDGAVILTVQNGLGNAETIAAACRGSVCHGVTMNAGEVTAPGEIAQAEVGPTWLGPYRAEMPQARGWGDLLARAGLETQVLPDPRGVIWSKLIFNAAVNPLPVVTGLRLADVYAHPAAYALLRALVEEGKAVAAARGIVLPVDPMTVIDEHRALGSRHTHQGSMKQDIDRGRPTEIETLTGALIAEADRGGVPVPALRTVYRLVKAIETAAVATRAPAEARG